MKGEVILSNSNHTVGFLYFENFEGVKTDISLQYLKDAIRYLEDFEEKGLAPEEVTVGIEREEVGQPSTIVFFLDKKQKCGIAIAPIITNKEETEE